MKIMHDTQYRRFKDPAILTDYEKSLVELKKQGLTHKQIAQTYKASENTISNKFTVINQKLKLSEMEK
jgi:DNA-binding NarL/FixJ family response regulator